MFSLKALLDKVSQVQSELTEKLNTSSGSSTPDLRPVPENNNNLATGTELLNQYQTLWENIHRTSMIQSEHASQTAQEITQIHGKIQHQDFLLNQLTSHLAEIPALSVTIERCTSIVRETGLNISSLQVELTKLEEECDKLQMQRMMSVHHHHVNSYRQQRQQELVKKKREMERNYQDSAKQKVAQECIVMKERHATFDAEFQKDLDDFKSRGNLVVRDTRPEPLDTLADFKPEEDYGLSEFLDSSLEVSSKVNSLEIQNVPNLEIQNVPNLEIQNVPNLEIENIPSSEEFQSNINSLEASTSSQLDNCPDNNINNEVLQD